MRVSLAWDRRLRVLFGAAVWVGALALALFLYGGGRPATQAVAIVQAREHRLSPVRLGRLLTLEVTEGQRVQPGQVIARFDTGQLERQVSLAEAKLAQASTSVPAAEGALDSGNQQAGRAFRAEIDSIEVELNAARAAQAREQSELTKLTGDIERERELLRRGLTTSDRLVAMEQRRAPLEDAARTWPARIAALEGRAQAAQARLAAWEAASASKGTRLQPLEAKVRTERQSVSLLRARVDESTLVATVEGIVSLVQARPGAVVKPGDPVVTVIEARPRQALAYVDERRGTPLAPGTKIVARRRGSTQWTAVVSHLAPDVTPLPERVRLNPLMPAWGRAMYITLPAGAEVEAGELLEVAEVPGNEQGLRRQAWGIRP